MSAYLKQLENLPKIGKEESKEEIEKEKELIEILEDTVQMGMDGIPFYMLGVFYTYCRFKKITEVGDIDLLDEFSKLKTITLSEYKEKYPDKSVFYEFFEWFSVND